MDVKDYRRRYEAELAAKSASPPTVATHRFAGAVGAVARHLEEVLKVPLAHHDLSDHIPALLATLRNRQETVAVRHAALQALRAATFLGDHFAPFRVDFLNTLRLLATPDTDAGLREEALDVLAAEKDPDAQNLLRRGLQEPQSALVPPTKALQLLGYDDHANVADLARDIFHRTVDVAVKEAALRLLATDAKSQDLFAQVMQDKAQPRSLRALSATGLHFLNPDKFATIARGIVMDDSDFEDIRATSLGALANSPDHALSKDTGFLDRVKQLGDQHPLQNLRAAAMRMIKP